MFSEHIFVSQVSYCLGNGAIYLHFECEFAICIECNAIKNGVL